MPKRDNTEKQAGNAPSRGDTVRGAFDQALQATAEQAEGTQRRVQELADELTTVVGRLRDGLDSARPVTGADLDAVRADIADLADRVAALEAAAKPAGRPAARKPGAKAPAKKPAKPRPTATSRVPAARAAARRTAGKRPD